MHGMEPDDEIAYWRERATKAEASRDSAAEYMRQLEEVRAENERLKGIEIRRFYISDCADRWGARVWCSVTDGPNHDTNERTKWSVYHRPNVDEQWPAKIVPADSLDEALRIGREFAATYRTEMAAISTLTTEKTK